MALSNSQKESFGSGGISREVSSACYLASR
jgi:hypothetical protein